MQLSGLSKRSHPLMGTQTGSHFLNELIVPVGHIGNYSFVMLVDARGHGGPIADKWCVHFWNVFHLKKR